MFKVLKKDTNSRARIGTIETPHGIVETPAYVIVGTHGSVRSLAPEDIVATKTQMVISNTYHLWRSLQDEGLENFPGLHAMMGWNGVMMTDSGGFQVFSLGASKKQGIGKTISSEASWGRGESLVRITEAGVYFKTDEEDPEEHYLDAETSVRIQEQLGGDIIVAFDEPTSPIETHEYTASAMERTHRWAERSLEAKQSKQLMYGVVQGGTFEDLRNESARFIGGLPFDGFAIGGSYGDSYGGTQVGTKRELEWTIPLLPDDRPRHLFGIGKVQDLFYGVEAGIDTFDCVIPTREARHGRLWIRGGYIDITKGVYENDDRPIDESCMCPVCTDSETPLKTGFLTGRAELHTLFKIKSPEASRLATIHNVYFFNNLMEEIRRSISDDRFLEFKKEYLKE